MRSEIAYVAFVLGLN